MEKISDLPQNPPLQQTAVSGSIFYKRLCVLIETQDGKIFQASLNQEMCDTLFQDLKDYYSDGVVKILPDEIHGVTFQVTD
jgi:hypothetical protein